MVSFSVSQGLQTLAHACLQLLMNPLLYVFVLLVVIDVLRNVRAERRFFGIRVTRIWVPMVKRHAVTFVTGLVISIFLIIFGAQVTYSEVLIVSALSLVLALLRVRFIHFGYSILVFILLSDLARHHTLVGTFWNQHFWFVNQWNILGRAHVASWLAVLCAGFLCEVFLTRIYQRYVGTPALISSRRGRQFGATKVQLSFTVPLFLLAPGHLSILQVPNHWPLLYQIMGVSLTAFPLLMGTSFLTTTRNPSYWLQRHNLSSILLFLFSSVSLVLLQTIDFKLDLYLVLAMILWQEYTVRYFHWREHHDDSLCAPHSEGVVVLHTIRKSLSESIGLAIGETITHVNQVTVHTEYDLHFAFDQNPAYAKLQVIDLRGEIRIIGKPVYAGERHQLGLILVPPHVVSRPYQTRQIGLLQTLYLRTQPVTNNFLINQSKTITARQDF